ncbi:uncharacterized protein [Rutidosis leptorrhynchoides]|uniref:uncharacterized protein n=1 Tax=Rutidosis leptorrhynchoides TaxID=125765 RepID=UPI003A9A07C3
MECNKDEAIRAKEIAENKMKNNDFEGARKIALKAKKLYPDLDNISHLLAVCDVHCSAQKKINGTVNDLYGILQVEKSDDDVTIKKQYKKLALVLHPDKNRFPGAEAAFKLICEAHVILSDKGKRYLHDAKCGESAKLTVSKPAQNHQGNGAQSKSFNVPTSSSRDTFWTFCPFCRNKYEYYRTVVNKTMKCQKCLKIFIAYDIGVPQSAQPTFNSNVNPGRSTHSQQEEVGKQKKGRVDPQKADESFSRYANQHPRDAKVGDSTGSKKVENGNLDVKKRKQGVATKQTVSDSNGGNDEGQKRSRRRTQVSNSEETLNDLFPEKRFKGKQKEQKEASSEAGQKGASEQKKANVDTVGSMQNDENGHVKTNSDSEDNAEPVYVDVPESEFSNFDRDKEEHCFAVDQVWAVYDTVDGMPRFYAQIKKVYSSAFKLRIMWFEADPENDLEKKWAEEGLPVALGRFRRGDSEETKDRLMFSHRVSYEKGSKRFSFVIYPKKGEIWALFKDWDIKWSSDPENHKEYNFEIVEVLSDFDNDNGVLVAFMVKVEGFVSVFQKTSRVRLAEHRIPSNELFRFSHQIPSLKLTGNERADVPVGSFELDTASLPDDLGQFYVTNTTKMNPVQNSARSPEKKVNDFVVEKVNLRRSPRGLKDNCGQKNGVENKTNIASPSKGNKDKNVNTKSSEVSSSSGGKESKIIHDFNLDKQKRKFEVGQIWAIRESGKGNLRSYAQIKKIDGSPLILHVESLESCNDDAIRPNACGLYKPSCSGRKTINPDAFLYHVKAQVNGKNRFNIYPWEKEIWVLHKNKDFTCDFVDENAGDSDIVEVVDNSRDMITVSFLSRVPGYKSVFKCLEVERAVEIPFAESDRFIGRVPGFQLTEEIEDGHLRGCWELDLTEFPGLLAT